MTIAGTTALRPQVKPQSAWRKILKRPEAGALGGAILVFLFFLLIAPPFRQLPAFTTVLYQASTIGIPAVAVALLMIGGEFDLSAGVAVTTISLAASIFATHVAGSLWIGVIFSLAFALALGAINGWLLIKTKLPSFLVTLGSFLMLQGLNIAITKLITGNVATEEHQPDAGLRHVERHLRDQLEVRPRADLDCDRLLAGPRRHRHVGAPADQGRELDLRGRRPGRQRPGGRRPREAGEDRPVHDGRLRLLVPRDAPALRLQHRAIGRRHRQRAALHRGRGRRRPAC